MQNPKKSVSGNEGLNLESLMEALFYRDEFLTLASHELKTPLTAMRLHAQVFQRNSHKQLFNDAYEKETVDRLIMQVDLQTTRMIKLVENMLDISRIRTGQLIMTKAILNLSNLLKSVVKNRSICEFKRIKLKIDENIYINGDSDRISQVFHKLIDNAARHSKDHPIQVKLTNMKSKISFSVKDLGRGISDEDQKRIFHRFQRAIPASELSGLGLGLYIVREIVEAHNGHISLKSEVGEGSTFKVDFKREEIL